MWIRRLLGLQPVRVPPHAFALDDGGVSYLGLDPNEELYCRDCLREELPEDSFQEGPLGGRLRDDESLVGALDALLGKLVHRPEEASLVVPDDWLRLTFVEVEDWPRASEEQFEVLRFKLGRIVPFRVQELRLAFERVPNASGEGGHRFLVGFGIDSAFSQIERVFESRGVRIGSLSNSTLSTFTSLETSLASAPLGALVRVDRDRYSLLVTLSGEPVVYRGKAHSSVVGLGPAGRELRLTRSFLQERFPPGVLSEIVLAAPPELEGDWSSLVEEVFEQPVSSLSQEWPDLPGLVNLSTHAVAPLLGAALAEVA